MAYLGVRENLSFMVRVILSIWLIAFILPAAWSVSTTRDSRVDSNIISYTVDPKLQDISLYWKDDSGHILGSIQRLKDYLEHKDKKLVFATNGGMFKTDHSPVGLFIQQEIMLAPLDTSAGNGNFYLKPNGVFYLTKDKKANICPTTEFRSSEQVKFATQSGPMLLINNVIHPAFKDGSTNVNIRNGVGILPNGNIVFAMSKEAINFYEFVKYFKSLGCQNALYLDGFVSKTYLPEKKWIQTDGDFGVIIAVTVPEE